MIASDAPFMSQYVMKLSIAWSILLSSGLSDMLFVRISLIEIGYMY